MRRLLVSLLATSAFSSAFAAPVVYEFRAVVGAQQAPFPGPNYASLTRGRRVVGTLTLDPARTENGVIAPVVALKLVALDNGEVIFDSNGQSTSSSLATSTAGGAESVTIDATFERELLSTRMEFTWRAPGQSQLPADPHSLNILALEPYGWKLAIRGSEVFPCESSHCRTDFEDLQITSFKRAAASAEYTQSFASTTPRWVNSGGNWTAQSGYFANAANVAFTSSVYNSQTLQPFAEVSADLYSGLTGAGNAVGLVVNYQNASNFNEVRFTGNGVVTINKVVNGVRTMLQTGSYSAPPKTFFHVSVLLDFGSIEVRVNNAPAVIAEGATLKDGHAGVFSSFNNARADNFAIDQLSDWGTGFQASFEFQEPNPFTPRAGTWVVQNNSYQNTTSQVAAVSTGGFPPAGGDFVLFADMRLQWAGAGNRGGLVWDYLDQQNYSAVLVSPSASGRASTLEVIEVVKGVRRVLATANPEAFPAGFVGRIGVNRIDGVVRIWTAGTTVPDLVVRQQARGGNVGVIASWNLVRFDNVVFSAQNGPT